MDEQGLRIRAVGVLAVFIALIGCTACALKSSGRLMALEDGTAIPLDMRFSRFGGEMVGTHPVTGEHLKGEYRATANRGVVVGAALGTVAYQGLTGTGKGAIVGDKGTVLDCDLTINAGNLVTRSAPTGFGTCLDQQGRKFQLLF